MISSWAVGRTRSRWPADSRFRRFRPPDCTAQGSSRVSHVTAWVRSAGRGRRRRAGTGVVPGSAVAQWRSAFMSLTTITLRAVSTAPDSRSRCSPVMTALRVTPVAWAISSWLRPVSRTTSDPRPGAVSSTSRRSVRASRATSGRVSSSVRCASDSRSRERAWRIKSMTRPCCSTNRRNRSASSTTAVQGVSATTSAVRVVPWKTDTSPSRSPGPRNASQVTTPPGSRHTTFASPSVSASRCVPGDP